MFIIKTVLLSASEAEQIITQALQDIGVPGSIDGQPVGRSVLMRLANHRSDQVVPTRIEIENLDTVLR